MSCIAFFVSVCYLSSVIPVVEFGIEGVEILGIQLILCEAERFAETLKMYDLPLAEKSYRIADIGVVG